MKKTVLLFTSLIMIAAIIGSRTFAIGPNNYNHESNIISGDGSVYMIGSGEDLPFVFENTLDRFHGEGLLSIDDEFVDIDNDVLINIQTSTITLLGRYLDTLTAGEHRLEALFPEESDGFAQASFTVVNPELKPAKPVDSIIATYPYYAFVENPDEPWQTVWDALDSTDTINYSDSYFDVPSPGVHPELRAVSYALALAGFENEADGYPFDGSTPNLKLTTFLNQLGFSDYWKHDTVSDEDGHSMGTTIARKILPNGQTLIVVAPRNYNYMTEWLSNFNVGASGDHAGFTESAEYIKDRLDEYIYVRHLSDYKIWMVGYSRGGAVVDLMAKMINENLSDYDMVADDFYVYTFGAPHASLTAPGYTNIHDVKDGNDLLLGYVFPERWGFHNTGTYEEIHPADLEIPTSVINIADLSNPATAATVLINNDGITEQVSTMNGRDFMDDWVEFITENGLTRDYFNSEVKPPLSEIMKLYQLRKLDEQSDFTNFFKGMDGNGLAGRVAFNALNDLGNYGGDLASFPTYLNLVKILNGTATEEEADALVAALTNYMDEYDNYKNIDDEGPSIEKNEFEVIKSNLPKLVKSLLPIIIADAKYTQETFGEDYSLYYTYTLISNAESLVIGHIPESIMPILKSLMPRNATFSFSEASLPYVTDPEHGLMNVFFDDIQIHDQAFTYKENISHEHKLSFELAFEYGSLIGQWALTDVTVNGKSEKFEKDITAEGDRYNITVGESDNYVIGLTMVRTGGGGNTIIWGNPGVKNLDDEDALLSHGSAKAIAVYNPEGELVPEEAWNIHDSDGGVDEGYGHIVVSPNSKVVFEFIPDYGYQLTSVTANGVPLEAQDSANRYIFTMPDTNIHFAATFSKTEDIVLASSEKIDAGTIMLSNDELSAGTAQLLIQDVELTPDKITGFEKAAGVSSVVHYLDIDLFNVFYKGKNDSNDVWLNQIHQLNKDATITLKLTEDIDASNVVIVHNIDDGDEFEVIEIDSYDPATNTITFRTNSFSNFAIANKVSTPETGSSTKNIEQNCPQSIFSLILAVFIATIFSAGIWMVAIKSRKR